MITSNQYWSLIDWLIVFCGSGKFSCGAWSQDGTRLVLCVGAVILVSPTHDYKYTRSVIILHIQIHQNGRESLDFIVRPHLKHSLTRRVLILQQYMLNSKNLKIDLMEHTFFLKTSRYLILSALGGGEGEMKCPN